ncbi:hypothetical protein FOMPIDRAFT_1022521 [Fomitopsis schrenkii]|uniref:Uncharacterized protein n=1 Tax=Fomitopsis schrenkii TaxID=2126942 RepID=S8EE07_FOMSC|nr:hypothetical protein FOMPIDRAFT_1022521 [Fomitopsis schrenkii]
MATGYAGEVGESCGGLCCICCAEGFLDWLNFTRCCQGNPRQAGCCGPCWKRALDNDDDDWLDKEREERRRKRQPRAQKGVDPNAGAADALQPEESVDPSVVTAQPEPRASMEAGRPQEVTPADLAQRQGLSEVGGQQARDSTH